jgi:hypothetical protein
MKQSNENGGIEGSPIDACLPTRYDFFYPSGFSDKLGLVFVHDELLTKGKVETQFSIARI